MLIVHATEHCDESDTGFVHALALAAAHSGGADLVSLHVTQGKAEQPPAPSAAALLERWKLSPAPDVRQRLHECPGHDDVADELIAACESLRPDLVVLPTHARKGVLRLLAGSSAEAVARNLVAPCLLLPLAGRGFVDPSSGALDLGRLLVVGGASADTQLGLDSAAWLARSAGMSAAECVLLHVDDGTPAPAFNPPTGVQVRVERQVGAFERVVAQVADRTRASVVVMVSHGHDELRDVLWSSHTERVLHEVKRPLLWVPLAARARLSAGTGPERGCCSG